MVRHADCKRIKEHYAMAAHTTAAIFLVGQALKSSKALSVELDERAE